MSYQRAFLRRYPAIALLIIAAAMLLRILVPGGYMPTAEHGRLVLSICTGTGPVAGPEIPVKNDGMPGQKDAHGKSQQPCAFGGLSLPSLAAADPVVLALAAAFIIAVGLRPLSRLTLLQTSFLRPPLRAPPAHF